MNLFVTNRGKGSKKDYVGMEAGGLLSKSWALAALFSRSLEGNREEL